MLFIYCETAVRQLNGLGPERHQVQAPNSSYVSFLRLIARKIGFRWIRTTSAGVLHNFVM
jgi:hypothetical protein